MLEQFLSTFLQITLVLKLCPLKINSSMLDFLFVWSSIKAWYVRLWLMWCCVLHCGNMQSLSGHVWCIPELCWMLSLPFLFLLLLIFHAYSFNYSELSHCCVKINIYALQQLLLDNFLWQMFFCFLICRIWLTEVTTYIICQRYVCTVTVMCTWFSPCLFLSCRVLTVGKFGHMQICLCAHILCRKQSVHLHVAN